MIRYCAIALGGMALTLSACVYPPLPDPMAGLQNCHPFTQDITVQGHTVAGYGVQCVQADGTSIVAIPPQATPPSAAEVMQNLPPPTYADPNAYAYYAPYTGVDPAFPAYSGYWPYYSGPDIVIGGGWGWGGGWVWGGGWGGGGHWWHGGGWHGGGWGGGWGGHGGGHR